MAMDSTIEYAVVVGTAVQSPFIDWTDRESIYFGDGAGAAVLGRVPTGYGILCRDLFTNPVVYDSVRLRGGGSSHPMRAENVSEGLQFYEMNGMEVWKQVIQYQPRVIRGALAKIGKTVEDVDFFIFHQANLRLIEYLMAKMHQPMSRTYTNVERIGNTADASIALALAGAVRRGPDQARRSGRHLGRRGRLHVRRDDPALVLSVGEAPGAGLPTRWEDLRVGLEAVIEHTITEADVEAFAELTGDRNPLHLDPAFAARTQFGRPIAHGMLSASFVSTAIGMALPGPGALWTGLSIRFERPVFAGDAITVLVRVRHRSEATRTLVLDISVRGSGGTEVITGEANVRVLTQTDEDIRPTPASHRSSS